MDTRSLLILALVFLAFAAACLYAVRFSQIDINEILTVKDAIEIEPARHIRLSVPAQENFGIEPVAKKLRRTGHRLANTAEVAVAATRAAIDRPYVIVGADDRGNLAQYRFPLTAEEEKKRRASNKPIEISYLIASVKNTKIL